MFSELKGYKFGLIFLKFQYLLHFLSVGLKHQKPFGALGFDRLHCESCVDALPSSV